MPYEDFDAIYYGERQSVIDRPKLTMFTSWDLPEDTIGLRVDMRSGIDMYTHLGGPSTVIHLDRAMQHKLMSWLLKENGLADHVCPPECPDPDAHSLDSEDISEMTDVCDFCGADRWTYCDQDTCPYPTEHDNMWNSTTGNHLSCERRE